MYLALVSVSFVAIYMPRRHSVDSVDCCKLCVYEQSAVVARDGAGDGVESGADVGSVAQEAAARNSWKLSIAAFIFRTAATKTTTAATIMQPVAAAAVCVCVCVCLQVAANVANII